MKCPICESENLKITDSRHQNYSVKRKRKCLDCDYGWHTYELPISEEEYKVYLSKQNKNGYANFTEEEDKLIREYLAEGLTTAKIGRLLGRSKHSVKGRIRKLGLTRTWYIKELAN